MPEEVSTLMKYKCTVCKTVYEGADAWDRAVACEEQGVEVNDHPVGRLLQFQTTRQVVQVVGVELDGHQYKHRLTFITGNEILMQNSIDLVPADEEVIERMRLWSKAHFGAQPDTQSVVDGQ